MKITRRYPRNSRPGIHEFLTDRCTYAERKLWPASISPGAGTIVRVLNAHTSDGGNGKVPFQNVTRRNRGNTDALNVARANFHRFA